MTGSPRPSSKARPSAPPEPAPARQPGPAEHEFSDAQKDKFQSLAASLSFVGVSTMLFGVMSGVFALGAMYAGYAANGAALLALSGVFVATAWWTVSAGRSLSSMVTTRGRDVERLMQTVEQLRRLFGFTRVSIIVVAVGLVGVAAFIVWCTMLADKGARCPAGFW
jgi:nitrate reductase NapE component